MTHPVNKEQTCEVCGKPKCDPMGRTCPDGLVTHYMNFCHGHQETPKEVEKSCSGPEFCGGCRGCIGQDTPKEAGGWEEEFQGYVDELRTSNEYTKEPVYFGFRKVLRDEHGNDNLVTATDWCHVKAFIRSAIQAAKKEAVEALVGAIPEKDEGEGWEEFFKNRSVEPCCPGDDIAHGWNAAIKAIHAAANRITKV